MQFLTIEESSLLQSILINHTLLADEDSRPASLINCGLGKLCGEIPLQGPSNKFVNILYAHLSLPHVAAEISGEPGLIVFLTYISEPPNDGSLSFEDKTFLKIVIDKCKQWHAHGSHRQSLMKQLLNQERQNRQQRMSAPFQTPIKIDKDVIVSYDLESQMTKFRKQLGYEGAFAFSIGGDVTILEHYIIERMMRVLRSKTGRPCIRFSVRLYPDDLLSGISAIEHKLVTSQICDSLPRWFDDNLGVDIVLVVWNYDIPPGAMKSVASSFWEEINIQVTPCLKNQSRCLVVIWANVGSRKYFIDQSIAIPMPTRFEVSELEQWFRGQLIHLGLEESFVLRYLLRLKNQHGHIIGTFQEMQSIIHEIQGGIALYD